MKTNPKQALFFVRGLCILMIVCSAVCALCYNRNWATEPLQPSSPDRLTLQSASASWLDRDALKPIPNSSKGAKPRLALELTLLCAAAALTLVSAALTRAARQVLLFLQSYISFMGGHTAPMLA